MGLDIFQENIFSTIRKLMAILDLSTTGTNDLFVIKSARGFGFPASTLGITLRLQPPPSSLSSSVVSVANTCNCRQTKNSWKKSAADKYIKKLTFSIAYKCLQSKKVSDLIHQTHALYPVSDKK
jgi:hypothetical protein